MTLSAVRPSATAVDLLPSMLTSIGGVREVVFDRLPTPPAVEDRATTTAAQKRLIAEARAAQQPGDSFTETLLDLAADQGQAELAVPLATFHQSLIAATASYRVPIEQLTAERLERLCAETPTTEMLVMSSAVVTSNGARHIPMLDFKLAASRQHDDAAICVATALGAGWTFRSGSSYHYYGAKLLTENELFDWLLRAQLLGRYVDSRWVTHQLLERRCSLRISRKGWRDFPELLHDGTPSRPTSD